MVTRIAGNLTGRVQGPPRGSWEKERLSLQSEKEETARLYSLELESVSEFPRMPREPDSPSAGLAREDEPSQVGAVNARLRQIDEALHRIRTGRFGLCTSCGIEISRARLERDLATEYCLVCQAESEIDNPRHTL